MKIKLYQVDAFTNKLFHGNPAAVCILERPISEKLMQQIAMENNLSETAFLLQNEEAFDIRYFSPQTEIDLCGHASLASAFVLDQFYFKDASDIILNTHKVGQISVSVKDDLYTLNLPVDDYVEEHSLTNLLVDILGLKPKQIFRGRTDLMAVFETQDQIKQIQPDFIALKQLDIRGLIVTAPGSESDIVCRFFCPAIGVKEDPVTGSAHTTLVPYWSKKLGKSNLVSHQLSDRGGELFCENKGDRIEVSGKAVLYLEGEFELKL